MDETTKRFLASRQQSLANLEERLSEVEEGLKTASTGKKRYEAARKLIRDAGTLHDKMDTEHQPAKRLRDAVITRRRANDAASLAENMQELQVSPGSHSSESVSALDKQVTLKARLVQSKVQEVVFRNMSSLAKEDGKTAPGQRAMTRFLQDCAGLVDDSSDANLPRVSIAATLVYASTFQLLTYNHGTQNDGKLLSLPWDLDTVRGKLDHASSLCDRLTNCEELREAVDAMARLFEGPRYERVTPEEIEAIKAAMVSGRGGISTHSGHWYNCANGHPVSGLTGLPCAWLVFSDSDSLPLASAACRWSLRAALNVEPRSAARATSSSKARPALRPWSDGRCRFGGKERVAFPTDGDICFRV